MGVSIPKVRQALAIIQEEYKADEERAKDIIVDLNSKDDGRSLNKICEGDLSPLVPYFKSKKTPARVEKVEAEVITPLGRGELPADIGDRIDDVIKTTCDKYKIEDIRKAPATVWRSLCMAVGFMFRDTKILHDEERERKEGGTRYDPERVERIIDAWAFMCGAYDKAPLVADFIAFTGISKEWFYDTRDCLTSSRRPIVQKVHELQEGGISSALVDGRRNPTGAIFFLKNWHGWKDSREVVHTDAPTSAPALYPSFEAPQIAKNGDL